MRISKSNFEKKVINRDLFAESKKINKGEFYESFLYQSPF